ncbi:MAG: hypothetical protein ACQERD_00405 [Campylobacterota bacterium]
MTNLKERDMKIKDKIKQSSSKAFNYPKIKSTKLKESIQIKVRQKAVLATKARLMENHKSFDDYTDEELEIIIADEERKIMDDLKTKSLAVALAALGLNFFI